LKGISLLSRGSVFRLEDISRDFGFSETRSVLEIPMSSGYEEAVLENIRPKITCARYIRLWSTEGMATSRFEANAMSIIQA